MAKAAKKRPAPPADVAVKYAAQRAVFEQRDDLQLRKQTIEDKRGTVLPKRTPALVKLFLDALRAGHTPKKASDICGINRSTAFNWRLKDDQFRKDWEDALDEGTDVFEQEAMRRAVDGIDKPVFQMGQCVGYTREYSDALLAMQLKGRRATVYGDKTKHEGGGPNGEFVHKIEVEFVASKGGK